MASLVEKIRCPHCDHTHERILASAPENPMTVVEFLTAIKPIIKEAQSYHFALGQKLLSALENLPEKATMPFYLIKFVDVIKTWLEVRRP